jgi:hypothetical protein
MGGVSENRALNLVRAADGRGTAAAQTDRWLPRAREILDQQKKTAGRHFIRLEIECGAGGRTGDAELIVEHVLNGGELQVELVKRARALGHHSLRVVSANTDSFDRGV